MELNEVLEKLPEHLLKLVIDQPYNEYTAQDHALWRYVMRRNVDYLQYVAHGSYLDGLRKTGISIDSIPHMYGMNRILKEIGWAAVAVDGFIPPAAFMEFQAYNVLVIAADIRPIDQIQYTPAPDIIHEAAGHAPIIADPEYAEYLRYFGEIGSKAFSSSADYKLYEGIRHLSIMKADPYTKAKDIDNAEKKLAALENNMGAPSEMALIRNLHWWTVEYGLIGDLRKPKIYGAGLLSSIGESINALKDSVKKITYSLDAKDYNFDITTMQPQLFVTPDFKTLTSVLDEFASLMALRTGGLTGINKAIESGNLATCVFSSGIQISGVFTDVIENHQSPVYVKTTGPTQLSFNNKELKGHGKKYHTDGFGSPIGRLKNSNTPLRFLSDSELENLHISFGKISKLEFESGIIVEGILFDLLRIEGKICLMSFRDCKLTLNEQILFDPTWGVFDMAVGDEIVSAYNGAADPDAFEMYYPVPKEKTHKIVHSESNKKLHFLYQKIRDFREKNEISEDIPDLINRVINDYPNEWLLQIELLEFISENKAYSAQAEQIKQNLIKLAKNNNELSGLVTNGLKLIGY